MNGTAPTPGARDLLARLAGTYPAPRGRWARSAAALLAAAHRAGPLVPTPAALDLAEAREHVALALSAAAAGGREAEARVRARAAALGRGDEDPDGIYYVAAAGYPEILIDRHCAPAAARAVWAAVEEASRAALGAAASGADSPRVNALYAGAARRTRALWIMLSALALRYPPAPELAAARRAKHRAWLAGLRAGANARPGRRDRGPISDIGRLRRAERAAYDAALAASFDPDFTLDQVSALERTSREAEARLRAAVEADEATRVAAASPLR